MEFYMIPSIGNQYIFCLAVLSLKSSEEQSQSLSKIKLIVSEFLKNLYPLQYESYKNIAEGLVKSCKSLEVSSIYPIATQNLLQGMRFLYNTNSKQLEYLFLGELYVNKEVEKAEKFSKEFSLDPTYAHSYTFRPDGTPALMTALARAGYQGDIEVARNLIPKVDTNFCFSNLNIFNAELPPAPLMVLFSRMITSKKIEMLSLFNKGEISPFVQTPEGWWLSKYFFAPFDHKNPEVLHTLLEGACDLNMSSVRNSSVLDDLLNNSRFESLKYISENYKKMFQEAVLENAIVLISHGVPLNKNTNIAQWPALQVNNHTISLQVAKNVHDEEKTNLALTKEKIVKALATAMSPPSTTIKPVINIVISYLNIHNIRVLTARNCFRRIFGYDPNK